MIRPLASDRFRIAFRGGIAMRRIGFLLLSSLLLSCVAVGVPDSGTEVRILEPPDSAWVTPPVGLVIGAAGGRGGWSWGFPLFFKEYSITSDTVYPVPAVVSVDGTPIIHLPGTAFVHHVTLNLSPGWHILSVQHDGKTSRHRIRVVPADAFPVRYHPVPRPTVFPRIVSLAKYRDTLLHKDGWVLRVDFAGPERRWRIEAGGDTLHLPQGGLLVVEYPSGYLLDSPWDHEERSVYWISASGVHRISLPEGLDASFLMIDPISHTAGLCGTQAILNFSAEKMRWFAILSAQGVRDTVFHVSPRVRIIPVCDGGRVRFRKVVPSPRSTIWFEKSLLIRTDGESLLVTPSRLYVLTPGWQPLGLPELPDVTRRSCTAPRRFFPPFFYSPFGCNYSLAPVQFYPGTPYLQVNQKFYRFELRAGGQP